MKQKINWSFEDPAQFTGTHEEKLEQIRRVRDLIKEEVLNFVKESLVESKVESKGL